MQPDPTRRGHRLRTRENTAGGRKEQPPQTIAPQQQHRTTSQNTHTHTHTHTLWRTRTHIQHRRSHRSNNKRTKPSHKHTVNLHSRIEQEARGFVPGGRRRSLLWHLTEEEEQKRFDGSTPAFHGEHTFAARKKKKSCRAFTFWRVLRPKSAWMYLIAPEITPTSTSAIG